jgi:curved DNA-binding protein CbpA
VLPTAGPRASAVGAGLLSRGMVPFDPYGLLGLGREATAAEIKLAYRRMAQLAHPDRGGDAERFVAVVRAFGLLSNPESRRLYDEAGIVDGEELRRFRREVLSILLDMFDTAVATALATGLDLARVDFIGQMVSAVNVGLRDAREALKRQDGAIDALGALGARIRRADRQHNLFAARLEEQVSARTAEGATLRRRLLLLETALVELGNYASEVDLIAALELEQERAGGA